jgi:hypothetical protein
MTGRQLPSELARVADLDPIGLADLVASADLQRRFDAKYLVEVAQLPALIEALGPRMRALEVDGARSAPYHTVYFDTPDLLTYRDHLQRRRRRFKVRTRHYGDPAGAMLEVKLKGPAARTLKYRLPHPGPSIDELGPDALAFVEGILAGEYGWHAPEGLAPTLVTRFDRTTLADLDVTERVTIDRNLRVEVDGHEVLLGGAHAVLEVKAPTPRGHATAALLELGRRPRSLSKYCLAVVALRPEVRGNPWLPTLRGLLDASADASLEGSADVGASSDDGSVAASA